MSGDLFPESVRLVSAERGDQYDEVVLNFSGYLPDDFKIAVAFVAPAENGAECCPGEFRDAVVEAMKRTCERIAALEVERDEARAHVRNHHKEACETCAAIEGERDAAREALRALLDASDALRKAHLHMLIHGPDSILDAFDWAREKAKSALAAGGAA